MADVIEPTGVQLGDLSQDIAFVTRTIRAHLRSEIAPLRADVGVAPGEIGVLRIIELNPGISQNDLASAVVIKKSAVTKVIRDLMSRQLVSREQVATDRRYNALTLTKEGQRLVRQLRQRVNALYDEWLSDFTTQEREQFFYLMNKLSLTLADRLLDLESADG